MTTIQTFFPNRIGGNVTKITYEAKGQVHSVLVDYGSSLDGSDRPEDFDEIWATNPPEAVLITHGHGDHVGRIRELPAGIPVYMGETTREQLVLIRKALLASRIPASEKEGLQKELELLQDDSRIRLYRAGEKVEALPGLLVTPYLVDHSAYDAYMLLLETPDRVILHTGDFRTHGRRGAKLFKLVKKYILQNGKREVDDLICEGTMLTRPEEELLTEYALENQAAEAIAANPYTYVICSSANLDSLAGFYHAARRNHRPFLVYNRYSLDMLRLFSDNAGRYSSFYRFDGVKLFRRTQNCVPGEAQDGFVALIKAEDWCEELVKPYLEQKPLIIYSMWEGYINPDKSACNHSWIAFLRRMQAAGAEVLHLHTSGHVGVKERDRFIQAVSPKRIYSIHTEAN